ncbi:WAS/WASL-interacting protein family member 1-like [Lathamus discolor]|uniref:WAS/WASL-interacting protein family member 1-like n=1 Tax=Lathamus discolor TaxID=678569 RepID=UPI0032B84CB4
MTSLLEQQPRRQTRLRAAATNTTLSRQACSPARLGSPRKRFPHEPGDTLDRGRPGPRWGSGVLVRRATDTCTLAGCRSTSAPGCFSVRPARHRHPGLRKRRRADWPPAAPPSPATRFSSAREGKDGDCLAARPLPPSLPPAPEPPRALARPPTSGCSDACAPQRRSRPAGRPPARPPTGSRPASARPAPAGLCPPPLRPPQDDRSARRPLFFHQRELRMPPALPLAHRSFPCCGCIPRALLVASASYFKRRWGLVAAASPSQPVALTQLLSVPLGSRRPLLGQPPQVTAGCLSPERHHLATARAVWGKNNALAVELDFSPFWDKRMLSIPCQEGTEHRSDECCIIKYSI